MKPRPQLLKLADIHRARRFGELDGENDLQACVDYIRKFTTGGAQLSHDEAFARARTLHRRLVAGEAVPTAPTGLPDLSAYPGEPIEQAIAHLEATLGEDFESLPDARKRAAAQELLDQIEAAGDGAADDGADDDPQLSAHQQAVQNLEARDPSFRRLSAEARAFGPRVRAEADRIRRLRAARGRGDEQRLLADHNSVVPPLTPVSPQPGRTPLPSLADLHAFPGARGVATDVGRAVTYMISIQPSFAAFPWDEQVARAADLVRNIRAREPRSVAGGAR